MVTLDNLKMATNASRCECATSYCSDTEDVFDTNQGLVYSDTSGSSSK